jgi:hypothetical protein
MAITNKIETAVKRLLVAGKVCSLWADEVIEEELSWSSDLTAPNTTETMLADIQVIEFNTAAPSLASVTFTLPDGIVHAWPGSLVLTVVGTDVELSNYTGGTVGDDSHFMAGGTPPGDNFNRAKLLISSPSSNYVLNAGISSQLHSFQYTQSIPVNEGASITLILDSVDGQAIRPLSRHQKVSVSFDYFSYDSDAPKCTKGEDYHDKDIAAFQVIASKGEESPPFSGNYLVNVRVLCSAQADDGSGALALVESRMDALQACLDTDDLADRITIAARSGLTVFPGSIWGRGVTEGVEGRKFSSGWEFTCMACKADL